MSELLVDGFFPRCKPTDRPDAATRLRLPRDRPAVRVRHGRHAPPGGVSAGPRPRRRQAGAAHARAVQRRRVQGRRAAPAAAGRAGRLVRRARSRRNCWKASTIWTTPSPAARPTTAGPSSAAACGFAAARPGRTTSASRPPAWPCPARRGRCGRLCVVPIGMEEGTETDVPIGRDRPGRRRAGPLPLLQFLGPQARPARRRALRLDARTNLAETDSLEAVLPADESIDEAYVPVRFHSRLTELGVLELWCVSTQTDKRWKLEFSVREDAE